MLRTLVPILIAAAILGLVTGIAALMIVLLGQDWEDALLWLLSAVMIGSALLVVTMRDIIRCGLAMIVCFGALAGIYVLLGAPLLGAAQVIVYIGAISVLILFAIMLTQTKDAPRVLVFQTQTAAAAVASILIAIVLALSITATDWGELPERVRLATNELSRILFTDAGNLLPFEVIGVLLLAAVIGGVFLAKREPGRAAVSNSLDAYLILSTLLFSIGTFGFLARRNAISMLMSIELMLNAVNLAIIAFAAFGAFGATPEGVSRGSVIALMVISVAAAEATVGLAIIIAIYRNRRTPLVDEYDAMRQ